MEGMCVEGGKFVCGWGEGGSVCVCVYECMCVYVCVRMFVHPLSFFRTKTFSPSPSPSPLSPS